MNFIFHHIVGMSSETHWRTQILQDGYCTTNQIINGVGLIDTYIIYGLIYIIWNIYYICEEYILIINISKIMWSKISLPSRY